MVSKGATIALIVVAVAATAGAAVALSRAQAAPPPPPPPPGGIASLTLASSVASGVVPLTVTFSGMARDATGAPVTNAAVYFFVNNQLQNFAVPILTDGTGAFSFQFTFNAAGTYVCFASSSTSGAIRSATITETVSGPPPPPPPPPPPTLTTLQIAATSPTTINTGGTVSFTVTALDQLGRLLSGVSGQITRGGVPLPGVTFTTGATGVATVTLQFLTAGTFQVGAMSGTIASAAVTVTVSAPPPPPPPPPPPGVASLTLAGSPLSGVAPLTVSFSGMALNSAGVGVANANIFIFANNVLQSTTPIVTGATGAFSFQLTFTAAGTYAIFVADNSAGT